MAELVARHPDRFVTACACLPMNDVDATLAEIDRAIDQLGFRGIEVFTDINGTPLDAPEFLPIFAAMAARDLPILLHPRRTNGTADYATEKRLERFPGLKIVTHHAGGLIPFFHKRIELSWDFNVQRMGYTNDGQTLSRSPLDYYRLFYCDTAIQLPIAGLTQERVSQRRGT